MRRRRVHRRGEAARLTNVFAKKVKLQLLFEADFIRPKQLPEPGLVTATSELVETQMRD